MSKLFALSGSLKRKDDKQAEDQQSAQQQQQQQQLQEDNISSQMDALQLQDYQNMALDQFERLVIVGMCAMSL